MINDQGFTSMLAFWEFSPRLSRRSHGPEEEADTQKHLQRPSLR
jgi:hypothetical protein